MCVEKYLFCTHCQRVLPIPVWDGQKKDTLVVEEYFCGCSGCARFHRLSIPELRVHPFFMINEQSCGGPNCGSNNCRVDRIYMDCTCLPEGSIYKYDYPK